jgi:single-stranded-DNA-specific exonuclease
LLLPDAEAAIERLKASIRDAETVAVFGDFDVDGVTASAILTVGLRELGARVLPYIPDRFTEGYGLNKEALTGLRQEGAGLLVTADCGTSSVDEIEHAKALGLEVIVVDHHSVPEVLPPAMVMVNPKRPESRYPERELATAGLAYKLMGALYESVGKAWEGQRYLELAALGTVADVVPLRDENRRLVRDGLAALSRSERPGLAALMEAAGIEAASVNAETVAYMLAPRLNAAGRLKHARLALELLLEGNEDRAREGALELTMLNQERQRQTRAAMELARELMSEEDPDRPLIFIGHEEIPSGIVGLVAGRLAEERHRPTVVYERSEETSRASCRSIPEFDITAALRNCSSLMVRFGGHRAAAGFTAENGKLEALKEGLLRQAEERLDGVELMPAIDIDATVPLHRMNGKAIDWLWEMEPFGAGNPEPTFLSRGLEVAEARTVGNDGTHLRMKLRDIGVTWPAIAFGLGPEGIEFNVTEGQRLDVVYSFARDQGGDGLELRVKDLAPATQ